MRFWRNKSQELVAPSPPQVAFSGYAPVNGLVFGDYRALLSGGSYNTVGRTEALSVPAVKRGRDLICSIATLPLHQVDGDNIEHRSALLEEFDPDVTNVATLSQTVEDLLFDGIAWWLIIDRDSTGFPTKVRRLDPGTVSVQPPYVNEHRAPLPSGIDPRDGVVYVDGRPVQHTSVIRFDSPNVGVLKVAGRAIRRAIELEQRAIMYAENPRPLDLITPSGDHDPTDDDEIRNMINQFQAAVRNGTPVYLPQPVNYVSVSHPSPAEMQLVELQKQASLDIANALGIDPEDLGISTTTRTYQNDVDRRRNKLNEVLAPYMRAITDTLSKGNVTRRGYRVVFDTTEYLLPNPGERWTTYATAKGLGAITVDEIREKEQMPPLPADAEPVPTTPQTVAEARSTPLLTFDAQSIVSFNLEASDLEFAVDKETRTIKGLALPYGQVASKNGLKFAFEPGSVQWGDPTRVKLLRDHDWAQALGYASKITDTSVGLFMQFKVARGPEGDRALELAEDKVLDGLSVGIDDLDGVPDPSDKSLMRVKRSALRETSLTASPSFDNARVTAVAASRTTGGGPVPDAITEPGAPVPETTPEPQPQPEPTNHQFTDHACGCGYQHGVHEPAGFGNEGPTPVNPTRAITFVNEPVPYRFGLPTPQGVQFVQGDYDFSTDLVRMGKAGDIRGEYSPEGKRVMGLLRATFAATTVSTDINELNPNIQRPDLWVTTQAHSYPLWSIINNGAPPNGIQPFTFPKMSASTIAVTGHTEGVEPPRGNVVTTSQTITPTALSGKSTVTRETWDMGGNPAISSVIFNEMRRHWFEGLETATGTFLNTLTAATDINLGVAVVDDALSDAWDRALLELQFERNYNYSVFAVEKWLYRAFGTAEDSTGRPLYPMIGPMNTNGTAQRLFQTLDLGGVTAIPTWGLAATSGSANNSWLFDPAYVHGWATAPQELTFAGTGTVDGTYAPVAMIDVAVWGYTAFANRDIGAVRQVIYDNAV